MVNKVPSYTISAGGRIAVVASRSHQNAGGVMVPACCDALESTGVETDDIYILDAPSDFLLPGLSRELSKSGFYSAVIALAILPNGEALAESVLNGMTTTDFPTPVIPGMVIGDHDETVLARTARAAARAAVEMTNLSGMLAEMRAAAAPSKRTGAVAKSTEGNGARTATANKRGRAKKKTTAAASKRTTASRGRTNKSEAETGSEAPKKRGRPKKTSV